MWDWREQWPSTLTTEVHRKALSCFAVHSVAPLWAAGSANQEIKVRGPGTLLVACFLLFL